MWQKSLELAYTFFALGAARVIAAGGDFMFDHAIADDEGDVCRELYRLKFE